MVRAPWWRADRFESRLPALQARAEITAVTRAFFAKSGFLEVETPALQRSPGLEPHLRAFSTALISANPEDRATAYLHTSPEYAMKKLLVAGLPRIFQLARVFRNEERSATHHPEFTMLEWYRAGAGYHDLLDDLRGLFAAIADQMVGGSVMTFDRKQCDPRADLQVLTVADAFAKHAQIDLLATMDDPANPDPRPLAEEAERQGFRCASDDRWDDVFFRIFLDRIEPKLGLDSPTVLTDYPASMAALARVKPEDPRLCERFEVYVCGLELANAFGELTDVDEQRRRFDADLALRQARYGDTLPIDWDFLAALDHGMPEAAGIALGFDRLVMLATGSATVEEVLWAPVFDPA